MRIPAWVVSVAAASLGLLSTGCVGTKINYPLMGQPGVKTLVNLHPDEEKRVVYSTNYQYNGLIPLCTDVSIDDATDEQVKFTVKETGTQYTYKRTKHTKEPWKTHLDKIFGTECPSTANLSDVDRQGIKQGEVFEGMSKQGVILALGYPPDHVTPNLNMNHWRYWTGTVSNFTVIFVDGIVKRIDGR